MKSQKSTAVRGVLALVAAGTALTLTACSAGQITQTSSQVAAVNGVEATLDNIALRDVALVVADDDSLAVKFTAANVENQGNKVTLQGITIDGEHVQLDGDKNILPGKSLIADSESAVKRYSENTDDLGNAYVATSLTGVKDVFIGGQKEIRLNFNIGSVTVNAPVVAYTTENAGELHRKNDASLTDRDGYKSDKEEHGGEQAH